MDRSGVLTFVDPSAPVRVMFRYRELLWQMLVRNFQSRHRGSILGVAWAVLNPLITLSIYVFVFGFVFGGRFDVIPDETNLDYALALFLGLTLFQGFAEAISVSAPLISANPNFVKKVVFPLEILPPAAVGAAVINMLITLLMALVGVAATGHMTLGVLLVPVILLPGVLFTLGLSWILSAVGVYFRDIGQIIGGLLTILMFASAIFYPASQIPAGAWLVLKFNPLIHLIAMLRDVLLWHRDIDWWTLGIVTCAALATSTVGFGVFVRLKRGFPDAI